jgi:hypothetical protein
MPDIIDDPMEEVPQEPNSCTHVVLMADTGGKGITDTFQFKHHAIPVLEITATDRIIDTTERLTAIIAGIQDAPPNEVEAIKSLHTLLLSKVALLPPPSPSILPPPPVLTPWSTSTNPSSFGTPRKFSHLLLLSITIPTTSAPTATLLQLLKMTVTMTHLPSFTAHTHLDTIIFAHCKTVPSHAINCNYALPI